MMFLKGETRRDGKKKNRFDPRRGLEENKGRIRLVGAATSFYSTKQPVFLSFNVSFALSLSLQIIYHASTS
jgi:hypothetical protein